MASEANERIEAAVSAELARQLGGVSRRHDDGSEDGMHDAFVDVGDRTIAVEITGETDLVSHVRAYSAGAIDTLEAVERHAQRQDNLSKLRRSTADERHLAVWVSVTATLPYAGLNEMGLLPVADPMVDDAIDVIWAMRLEQRDGEIEIPVVWRWSRADGWQCVGFQPPVLGD